MNSVVSKWQKRFVKWFCSVMVTDLMWIIGLQGWNHHWRVLFNFFWDDSLWNWLTEKRLNLEIWNCEQEIRFVRRTKCRMTKLIHFQIKPQIKLILSKWLQFIKLKKMHLFVTDIRCIFLNEHNLINFCSIVLVKFKLMISFKVESFSY